MSTIELAPIIAAATDYARRGWSVIPVKADKTPAARHWKIAQTVAAPADAVRTWFERVKGTAGVGIVLGQVSGDLYVRDFDDPAEYERWRLAFPQLAATLPTVRTRRGFHVYGRWKGVSTATMAGGELRGEGAYVVAPPSRNADGGVYAWLVTLPEGAVPEVDPYAVGLAVAKSKPGKHATEKTKRTETTETPETPERTEDTEDTEDPEAIWGCGDSRKKIESAIARTVPTGFGGRNIAVFRLARALHAIPHLHATPPDRLKRLKPLAREWYRRALPNIITKDFATTWGDFAHAWERVRTPEGADVLGEAMRAAEAADPPTWSAEYSPACRLLASLCRELQRRSGSNPFFLSAEKAGQCVEVDKATAARWLKAFRADGAIEVVTVGTVQSRKASRYLYKAPDLLDSAAAPAGTGDSA